MFHGQLRTKTKFIWWPTVLPVYGLMEFRSRQVNFGFHKVVQRYEIDRGWVDWAWAI